MKLERKHKSLIRLAIATVLLSSPYVYMLVMANMNERVNDLFNVTLDNAMLVDFILLGIAPLLIQIVSFLYFILVIRRMRREQRDSKINP